MAATSKPVASVTSKEEFDKIVASSPEVAVHFWADWCEPCKHMDEVFAKLAADAKQATFVRVREPSTTQPSRRRCPSRLCRTRRPLKAPARRWRRRRWMTSPSRTMSRLCPSSSSSR